ncbi:helix-turn-helix transcriptional regulator [Bacillus chungangensis]|uniref:Molybdopterin biosynthesis protein n=1 Tax=Bacillus chungangensis TaxID=587633 RepID=A0ABT9WV86_9BACI|nr:helix-turn-helix transcriptional regulator [Bacillus chungangensis]MDQ0177216.1 putative molybdopterin biosynthesis protein [Bacillus chungangensis]
MAQEQSYTIEEIAAMLRVSKLTVYDLIKKGELNSYRVGRQMRIDESDLKDYKEKQKTGGKKKSVISDEAASAPAGKSLVISGQDIALDLLSNRLQQHLGIRTLRSYTGSLNSLIDMYNGECDLVSMHLFDGESGSYNLPYVKRILSGHSFLVVHLLARWAGFYVKKGNPKKIQSWEDLMRDDVVMVNREKGSGARVLVDEQLLLHHLAKKDIHGYDNEEQTHISVASAVARGTADVGIGIEKPSRMVDVSFIPLIKESYDLVILKKTGNEKYRQGLLDILQSNSFQKELGGMGDYDLTDIGKIIYEAH